MAKPSEWSREGILRCNSYGLVVTIARQKNKATEPVQFPSPCKTYCWAQKEAVAVTTGLQRILPAALRIGELETFLLECQAHIVADPSDKHGDTEVKQLRSGSHHYWEDNKATNS